MQQSFTIFPLGDRALTIDFGNRIDDSINQKVLQLFQRLQNFSPFIKDVIPAYSSLTVYYDVVALQARERTAFDAMKNLIVPLLENLDTTINHRRRTVRIPVCYAKAFALDLEELALQKNLSVEEVIHLHTAKVYRVYMIGFLPSFAYMGKVDERIATPRKSTPRTSIPAGSVGIAGEQTGIYPLASPGGWNIVGRTPLTLFDKTKEQPALLQSGDEVQFFSINAEEFFSITRHEFKNYQSRNT